jgi:hypothetical protein
MNWLALLMDGLEVIESALPTLRNKLSGKTGNIVGAGFGVGTAIAGAVEAKGSPASVGAVASAVAAVASAAGLSEHDKSNIASLANAAALVGPIMASVGGAVEPKHLDVINTVLANAMAVGNGLAAGFAPATEPTSAMDAPAAAAG